MNRPPSDYDHTLRMAPVFAGLSAFIQQLFIGNVEMAAYATALNGIAAAQALHLKFHPPSPSENGVRGDNCEEYTDTQLIDLAKKLEMPIPPELLNDET